ncbi:alpha beta hydrolase fold family [Moniliophthora roreri]|nr:alpha beta hydrolase fold family [Moniliophthora roreri]
MGWPTKTLLTSACIFVSLTKCAVSQATWNESSWLSITPTKNLTWVPCYDGDLECGRFQVPLNYSDPEGQSAAIALVRMKANVSVDSTDYLGPILLNPGGPGGSGVDLILTFGTRFRETLGPQFDLRQVECLGWHHALTIPPGVSRSTPRVTFFETLEERLLWGRGGILEPNSSLQDNVGSYWSRAKIIGQLAGERAGDILPFMNTDYTARDMLRITEAYGREKIQYWGISYGTVLGSTFASMFPDKVERLVIDGVVDVQDDYYTGERRSLVSDTDDAVRWFFKDCHDAGPEKCSFYESSVESIEERLDKLYQSIIRAPVPVRNAGISYGLVDYATLRSVIFSALYAPFDQWSTLATVLADLEKGNGTALFQMAIDAASPGPTPPLFESNTFEIQTAIGCNDGDVVPSSLEDAEQHYQEALKVSGWANPITPLANAHKVSKLFPGSVVLQQDSSGHSALRSPSLCTANAVRAYFVNGTLPEPGTVCPIDGNPFLTAPEPVKRSGGKEARRMGGPFQIS